MYLDVDVLQPELRYTLRRDLTPCYGNAKTTTRRTRCSVSLGTVGPQPKPKQRHPVLQSQRQVNYESEGIQITIER